MAEIKNPIIKVNKSMEQAIPVATSLNVSNLAKYQPNSIANQMLRASTDFAVNRAKADSQRKASKISIGLQEKMLKFSNEWETDKAKLQDSAFRDNMKTNFNMLVSQHKDEIINSGLSSQYIEKLTGDLEMTTGNKMFNMQSNFNNIENKQAIDDTNLDIDKINNLILTLDPTKDVALIEQYSNDRNDLIRVKSNYGLTDTDIEKQIIRDTVNTNVNILDKAIKQIITDKDTAIDTTITIDADGNEVKVPGKKQILEALASGINSKDYSEQWIQVLADADVNKETAEAYLQNNLSDIKADIEQRIAGYQEQIRNEEYKEYQIKKDIAMKELKSYQSSLKDLDLDLNSHDNLKIAEKVYGKELTANDIASNVNKQLEMFGTTISEANDKDSFVRLMNKTQVRAIEDTLTSNSIDKGRYNALSVLRTDLSGMSANNPVAIINSEKQLQANRSIRQVETSLFNAVESGGIIGDNAIVITSMIDNAYIGKNNLSNVSWNKSRSDLNKPSAKIGTKVDILREKNMDDYFFSILAGMKSNNKLTRDALVNAGYDFETAVNENDELYKLVNEVADILIDPNLTNEPISETVINENSARNIARSRKFEAYKSTADQSIPEIRDYLKEYGEEFKVKKVPTLLQDVNTNF